MQSIYFQKNHFTIEGAWSTDLVHLIIHTPSDEIFHIKATPSGSTLNHNLWQYDLECFTKDNPQTPLRSLQFLEPAPFDTLPSSFEQWLLAQEKNLLSSCFPHELEQSVYAPQWSFFQKTPPSFRADAHGTTPEDEGSFMGMDILSTHVGSHSSKGGALVRMLLLCSTDMSVFDTAPKDRKGSYADFQKHPLSHFFEMTYTNIQYQDALHLLPQFPQTEDIAKMADSKSPSAAFKELTQTDLDSVSALFFERLLNQFSFFHPNTPNTLFLYPQQEQSDTAEQIIFEALSAPKPSGTASIPNAQRIDQYACDLISLCAFFAPNESLYRMALQKGAQPAKVYGYLQQALNQMQENHYQSANDRRRILDHLPSFLAHSAKEQARVFFTFFSNYLDNKEQHIRALEDALEARSAAPQGIEKSKKHKKSALNASTLTHLTLSEQLDLHNYQRSSAEFVIKHTIKQIVESGCLAALEDLMHAVQAAPITVRKAFMEGAAQGAFNLLKDTPPPVLWNLFQDSTPYESHAPLPDIPRLESCCHQLYDLAQSIKKELNNPLQPPQQIDPKMFFYMFLWTSIDQHIPQYPDVALKGDASFLVDVPLFFDAFAQMRTLRSKGAGALLDMTHLNILQAVGVPMPQILEYIQKQNPNHLSPKVQSFFDSHLLEQSLAQSTARSSPKML